MSIYSQNVHISHNVHSHNGHTVICSQSTNLLLATLPPRSSVVGTNSLMVSALELETSVLCSIPNLGYIA